MISARAAHHIILLHPARSREARVICSKLPPIHFVMLPIYFVFHAFASHSISLDHTLHQLAPAVSDCVAKEGELTAQNKSEKLSSGVKLCKNTLVCAVLSPTDS